MLASIKADGATDPWPSCDCVMSGYCRPCKDRKLNPSMKPNIQRRS